MAVVDDDVVPLRFDQSSKVFKARNPLPLSSLHYIFAKMFWCLDAMPSALPEVAVVAEEPPV